MSQPSLFDASRQAPLLLQGDCFEVLKTLPDASVDSIVTDPPYLIDFMGKGWDSADGIAGKPEVWRECLRVLKPGGHLLSFGATRTYHRVACAIEDAGFEIRDSVHWMYSSGFPKSLNLKDEWDGWGTALKPAHEPVIVARKPLAGTVAANVQQYGTGALNIDASRVQYASDADMDQAKVPQPSFNSPTGNVYGFQAGEGRNGELFDPSKGRWPPNLLLSHTEDCTESACDETCAVKELDRQSDSSSRFFPVFRYQAKASRSERDLGLSAFPTKDAPANMNTRCVTCGRLKLDHAASRCACAVHVPAKQASREGAKNSHPTVKPIALMEWLVTLVTPPGGTVLDPFLGSGTTGIAAVRKGFRFIGIEREAEYLEIAKARIKAC